MRGIKTDKEQSMPGYKHRKIVLILGYLIPYSFLFLHSMYHSVYALAAAILTAYAVEFVDISLIYNKNTAYFEDEEKRKWFFKRNIRRTVFLLPFVPIPFVFHYLTWGS